MQVIPVLLKTQVTASQESFIHIIELGNRRKQRKITGLLELTELLQIIGIIKLFIVIHQVCLVLCT